MMKSQSSAGAMAATCAPANHSSRSVPRGLWGGNRRGRSADGQASMLRRQASPPGHSPSEPTCGVLRPLQESPTQQTRSLSNAVCTSSFSGGGSGSGSLRASMRVAAGLWQGRKTGGGMFGSREGRGCHLDLLRLASPLISLEAVGRRQGHAGTPHAMLDKSSGSTPPGACGEIGKLPQKVGVTALPSTSSKATTGGHAQTADSIQSLGGDGSARAALERLFAQAQLYEQRVGDPEFGTEEELEGVVRELEADLGQVLGMLRAKEEELTRAERKLEEEREEVEEAHAVLLQREGQLEAVRGDQVGRQEDLEAAKAALRQQRQETERVTAELRLREREVVAQREDVKRKAKEVQMANVQLTKQKGVSLELEALLVKKQRELGEALEEREEQRKELASLQGVLAAQREEHTALRTDFDFKRGRLVRVEKDLAIRTKAFSAARSEIQNLRSQLQGLTTDSHSSSLELQHAQALLSEVQDELRASHSAVLQFQAEVAEEEANGLRLELEISCLNSLLQTWERDLAANMGQRQKEAAELQKVQREFALAQQRVAELERQADEGRTELSQEKGKMVSLTEELTSLKKEMRQQTAALSDVQLSLQVKQAELLTTRLEVQQLRSDLSAAQLTVKNKTDELEEGQRTVASLRSELAMVRRQLAEKESKLAHLGAAIKEKDAAISLLQTDADLSRLKLSEAEHALEQIAQLSKMLAETAREGEAAAMSVEGSLADSLSRAALLAAKPQSAQELQQTLLSRANEDLFSTNSALLDLGMRHHKLQEVVEDQVGARDSLRAELEAVQECLREREAELESTRGELLTKESQLAAMVQQWEAREAEMDTMRHEVVEGAREIAALQDMARASGLGRGMATAGMLGEGELETVDPALAEEAAITKLELEVAKLEADSAIAALKALADLSTELKQGCQDDIKSVAVSSPVEATSHSTLAADDAAYAGASGSAIERMEEQLRERDAALNMAKQAMGNLTDLTRRLVVEASAAMNASMADGLGAC